MRLLHTALLGGLAAFGLCATVSGPANAASMKECSAKYKAAKADGSLAGESWKQFRAKQCTSAKPVAATKGAGTSVASAPAAVTKAPTSTGRATFPKAVDPKYAKETAGKARMHTCLDQYHANKADGGNGGLRWVQKGGGYYSECSKKLKG